MFFFAAVWSNNRPVSHAISKRCPRSLSPGHGAWLQVDEISVARQLQDQVRYWNQGDKISKTRELIRPQPDTPVLLGYGLWGLSELGYAPDSLTEAMVWYLAAAQRPDGSWAAADYRPPMEDGPIQGAAFAIQPSDCIRSRAGNRN